MEASTAIAAVALAVSLGTAGWQVLKGRPRVRVKLRACLYGDYRSYYGDTWAKALENANKVGGWHVEAALIEVENAGHLPATITLPAIDLGRGRRFSGELLPGRDATTEPRVRLEPFDQAVFILELWSVIGAAVDESQRRTRVRASVQVAGRRLLRKSSWRRGWWVRPHQLQFSPEPLELGMQAYRAMWRVSRRPFHEIAPLLTVPVALAVRDQFPLPAPAPNLEELMVGKAEPLGMADPMCRLYGLWLSQDLARTYLWAEEHPLGIADPPVYTVV